MKREMKEGINLISLIVGILFIILGLIGFSATIQEKSFITILSFILLLIGAFLSLMGGLRKWG